MFRSEIINDIIRQIHAQTYLEIGISCGSNFAAIHCNQKVGVDPDSNARAATFHLTSDDFFALNCDTFDVIFIDGLHHWEQVRRDMENALSCLSHHGVIVCHDMNPTSELMQKVPMESFEWTGDCWKAWVELRSQRHDLCMFVVDTDYGCGIICRGSQTLVSLNGVKLEWSGLCQNRKEWLNLVSIEEFRQRLALLPQLPVLNVAQAR